MSTKRIVFLVSVLLLATACSKDQLSNVAIEEQAIKQQVKAEIQEMNSVLNEDSNYKLESKELEDLAKDGLINNEELKELTSLSN